MSRYTSPLLALVSLAAMGVAQAQTPPPADQATAQPQQSQQATPPSEQTAPKAASSPHQRQTTSTPAREAGVNTATQPSDSSSPHQRQATGKERTDDQTMQQQRMKDCLTKERDKNAAATQDELKKTCMEQMRTTTTPSTG